MLNVHDVMDDTGVATFTETHVSDSYVNFQEPE
jgi:hypothetical protein